MPRLSRSFPPSPGSPAREENPACRVYLLDDHPAVRFGLRTALIAHPSLGVVGEGGSIADARRDLGRLRVQLLVADVSLGRENSLDALPMLREICPSLRLVVWTMHRDWEYLRRAADAGASAYVLKDQEISEVVGVLERVLAGESVYPAGFEAAPEQAEDESRRRVYRLSPREQDVLRWIGKGLMNKEIAGRMGISVRTVEKHRANLMEKLQCRHPVELARYLRWLD